MTSNPSAYLSGPENPTRKPSSTRLIIRIFAPRNAPGNPSKSIFFKEERPRSVDFKAAEHFLKHTIIAISIALRACILLGPKGTEIFGVPGAAVCEGGAAVEGAVFGTWFLERGPGVGAACGGVEGCFAHCEMGRLYAAVANVGSGVGELA